MIVIEVSTCNALVGWIGTLDLLKDLIDQGIVAVVQHVLQIALHDVKQLAVRTLHRTLRDDLVLTLDGVLFVLLARDVVCLLALLAAEVGLDGLLVDVAYHLAGAVGAFDAQLGAELGVTGAFEEQASLKQLVLCLVDLRTSFFLPVSGQEYLSWCEVLENLILNLQNLHAQLLVNCLREVLTQEVE